MALSWNEQAGRFVDARGRFVAESSVRATIDVIADGSSARMAQAAQAMLDGTMSLAEFQASLMHTSKLAHVATATIANGGAARMTPSDYLSSAREIKSQYRYAREFAAQIADGRQPLNGTVVSRARQYGQSARGHFEREYGRGQRARGFRFERNHLRSGESCSGCRAESARGWVPTGSLVPVGHRVPCRVQCKCVVQYRRDAAEAAA